MQVQNAVCAQHSITLRSCGSMCSCHRTHSPCCSCSAKVLAAAAAGGLAADVLARKHANSEDGASSMEIRVAVIGNVDSGKSTMVGVLTRSILDDGRGFARSKVFKHGHEEATGRTSSIGQHNLCVRPPVVMSWCGHVYCG